MRTRPLIVVLMLFEFPILVKWMSFTRGLACWTSIKEISFKILWAASIMVTIISLPPSQSLNTIWAPISPPLMEFREIRKTAQSMIMFMSGAGAILLQIFNIMCLSEFGGLQPPFLPKKGCKSFLSKILCKCPQTQKYIFST